MSCSRLFLRYSRPRFVPCISRARPAVNARSYSTPSVENEPAARQSSRLPAVLTVAGLTGAIAAYFLWPSPTRSAPTSSNQPISASHFTPITLTASESAGPNAKILVLNIPPASLPKSTDSTLFNPIWSVFIKDDDIQVERPYTPLEGIDENGNMRFWVKKYPKGEVGRWLHSKRVGDTVEIRGPLTTFHYPHNSMDDVVMVRFTFAFFFSYNRISKDPKISGGTGFSPFYQLLHNELLREPTKSSHTRFTLLHSSRNPSELPPPELLQPLLDIAKEHPERLRINLFVDSMDGQIAPAYDLQVQQIDKEGIENALELSSSSSGDPFWKRLLRVKASKSDNIHEKVVAVLVCGPEP